MATNPTDAPRMGAGAVPDFTLGDRLRKARESAHLEMQDLASAIDIHRQSVARYEQGLATPKRPVLLSWSLATGVDLQWIQTGSATGHQNAQTGGPTDSEFSGDSESITREFTRLFDRD